MLCPSCNESLPAAATACSACNAPAALDGRYHLEATIASGAVGTTYRATRIADGAAVAIKELPFRRLDNLKTLELCEREARVLRQLSHPGIPRGLDEFKSGLGKQTSYYIVQELIAGETIAAEMQRRRYSEHDVLDILAELAGILSYLHSRRPPVIHRDLKVSNVLRRPATDPVAPNALVVVDFGSVRDVFRDQAIGGSTVTGTFGYMAPEQFRGVATPATDLYALGVFAVVLLTRKNPEQLYDLRHQFNWQEELGQLHPAMLGLLRTLLEPEVEKRAADAEQVLVQIARVRQMMNNAPGMPVVGAVAAPQAAQGQERAPTPAARPVSTSGSGALTNRPRRELDEKRLAELRRAVARAGNPKGSKVARIVAGLGLAGFIGLAVSAAEPFIRHFEKRRLETAPAGAGHTLDAVTSELLAMTRVEFQKTIPSLAPCMVKDGMTKDGQLRVTFWLAHSGVRAVLNETYVERRRPEFARVEACVAGEIARAPFSLPDPGRALEMEAYLSWVPSHKLARLDRFQQQIGDLRFEAARVEGPDAQTTRALIEARQGAIEDCVLRALAAAHVDSLAHRIDLDFEIPRSGAVEIVGVSAAPELRLPARAEDNGNPPVEPALAECVRAKLNAPPELSEAGAPTRVTIAIELAGPES